MRINKYVAQATGVSRRAADTLITEQRVFIDGTVASPGDSVQGSQHITLDGKSLHTPTTTTTLLFNKPVGYIVSRNGQGGKTMYDILPEEFHTLKPIGRLDKNSSGLLLLTDDGRLAQELTHPSYHKNKVYEVVLDQPLQPLHRQMINDIGIDLPDGKSQLQLERLRENSDRHWKIIMHEGRNRQIRRTFEALGYAVTRLHRTQFGGYSLGSLPSGHYENLAS